MQNVWLYSAKWSHLNKDKRDSRTFLLVKQIFSRLETLEKRAVIYHFIIHLFTLVIFMEVDNISSHC